MVADRFREIWVRLEDGQALCALINGDCGWLLYLRAPEDTGLHSWNPSYDGPADAMIQYRLANGQTDLYPRAWALPVTEVQRALEYFRRNHRPPPFIAWQDDAHERSGTA